MPISVVICAYTEQRWGDLVAAVDSVRQQTLRAAEIIVVADHNPNLYRRIQQELPDVVPTENHEIRGLGGARNSGLAVARGDVVAFLDDDAIAAPDWLWWLHQGYGDPAVLGVGGAIRPRWVGGRPAWFPEEFDWVVGCTYRGMPESASAVRNVHGANMSYRRQAFADVGTFRLGYGCDETEFCIRLRRELPSALVLYEPRAVVYHTVPADRARWGYVSSRCYFEGRSKAVVSWLQGTKDGLASERDYTFRTLPRGVARGVADAGIRGDLAGLTRAATILGCLAITTTGYLTGKLTVRQAARERGYFEPAQSEAV